MNKSAAHLPSRLASLACLVLLLTLLPLSAVQAQMTPPAPGTTSDEGSLSFTPMPAIYESGPQFEARSEAADSAGHFTFDVSGYTFTALNLGSGDLAAVRMQFELGRAQALLAVDRLTGEPALRQGDATARRNLPAYGRLIYQGLYPGVDLQLEGQPGRLKGLYIVAAGADPANIQWRYTGAAAVEVTQPNGELWVRLPGERGGSRYLISGAPIAWQEVGTRKLPVSAGYQVSADGRVSFELGEYDRSRPLIIDPYLSYTSID